jgi:hypothetical protein
MPPGMERAVVGHHVMVAGRENEVVRRVHPTQEARQSSFGSATHPRCQAAPSH